MKRFLSILLLCLSVFVLNAVCVVYAESNVDLALAEVMNVQPSIDSDNDGEPPSPTDPGIDEDRPYQNEDPTEFPNYNPDIGYKPVKETESDNDFESGINKSSAWLYVGVGVGIVAVVVGAVLVVKAIKRKKEQW